MKPKLSELTLRERIAQTGMVAPSEIIKGAAECGGWAEYFQKYPFSGTYVNFSCRDMDGKPFEDPLKLGEVIRDASVKAKIPLLVTADEEFGCDDSFKCLHAVSTNLALGAAAKGELAYWRSYYWAKEARSFGVNWLFGPVVDLVKNFFAGPHAVRSLGAHAAPAQELIPYIIKGIHDAGVGDCVKHYPGGSTDYRDSHLANTVNNVTKESWFANEFHVYQAAIQAGTNGIMVDHAAVPAFDPSFARGKVPRPATASKPVLDIIRNELNYDGIIITDAVSMKGLSAAFDHEDIYIECFNAGNDIILFCRNDYIDVMERAVKDGRVSEERINKSCQRVLDLKEKLGLFKGVPVPEMLSEEEVKALENACYEVSKHALTLLNNVDNIVPFDPNKVKKVSIIKVCPTDVLDPTIQNLAKAFEARGIEVNLMPHARKKDDLAKAAEESDLIVYACYVGYGATSVYFNPESHATMFNSLSYGASKSVVVSFGIPSFYYDFFESADAFINAYSKDPSTAKAVVDGILGDFEFTGTSPVPLKPEFKFDV